MKRKLLIFKLVYLFLDRDYIFDLERYNRLLSGRNLCLNAVNLFSIDYRLIFNIFSAVITYTLILNQIR